MTCGTASRSARCLTPTAPMATPAARIAALSTYLGHVDPGKTYWYLQAAPELMALAGRTAGAPPRRRAVSALADSLQALFTDRLVRERNASPHTIAVLPRHDPAAAHLRLPDSSASSHHASTSAQLDAPLIGAFLDHLEADRGCSAADAQHAPGRDPHVLPLLPCCAIPSTPPRSNGSWQIGPKRHERALVTYLTEPELDALIDAPDRATWTGRRDHAIIILLAQTGLRASELTGLACGDIHLGTGAHVTTTGKGRKQRITPLTKDDHRGAARVACRTRRPAGRAAVSDQHRQAADPQSARATDRTARRPRRRALPVADRQDDHAARPAPHRRDAAAARRRRHHRDRALARTRASRNHPDVPPRRPRASKNERSTRTKPPDGKPGRYRPPDALLRFLDGL